MKQPIRLALLFAMVALLTCCGNRDDKTNDVKSDVAWRHYNEARQAKNLELTLAVIDSMERAKIVSTAKADRLRGLAYDQGWQMRVAEHYYKKSYEGYAAKPTKEWYEYTDAGYRWAYLRHTRGDTEGALSVITGLLAKAEGKKEFPTISKVALLLLLSDIQLQLHQYDEALLTGQKAYETEQEDAHNPNRRGWNQAWVCMHMASNVHKTGDVEGALEWVDRCAQAIALSEQEQEDSLLIEEWKGHVALKRALYLYESGHPAEAAATYASVPRSRLFEPRAYHEAADYLMVAGRYDEAAHWYEQIDSTYVATDGARMTFDNIAERLSPRYSAYRKAKRNADALIIADSISAAIDSALVWQKKNCAAELAVIYQTHEKELALEESQFRATLYFFFVMASLLVILLIGYLWWRAARYNSELRAKNRRLLAEIEQHEQEEQKTIEQLKAEPVEVLNTSQQLFRRLCTLMDEQQPYTDENLNRDTLAQMLGTNGKYIDQAITECSNGDSTHDFINRYRLHRIATLLKTTDDSIAIIGEMCGIVSRSTLSRIFRDYYGMTPSEYRNISRE